MNKGRASSSSPFPSSLTSEVPTAHRLNGPLSRGCRLRGGSGSLMPQPSACMGSGQPSFLLKLQFLLHPCSCTAASRHRILGQGGMLGRAPRRAAPIICPQVITGTVRALNLGDGNTVLSASLSVAPESQGQWSSPFHRRGHGGPWPAPENPTVVLHQVLVSQHLLHSQIYL